MIINIDKISRVKLTLQQKDVDNNITYSYVLLDSSNDNNIVRELRYSGGSNLAFTTLSISLILQNNLIVPLPGDIYILEADIVTPDGNYSFEIVNKFYAGESKQLSNPLGLTNIEARDFMFFAMSKHADAIQAESCSNFIVRIADKYQFRIDSVPVISELLPSYVFESDSVYDMWMTALTHAMTRTKVPYRIYMTHKGLKVEEIKLKNAVWHFIADKDGGNIVEAIRILSTFDELFANAVTTYIGGEQSDGDVDVTEAIKTLGNITPQNMIKYDESSIKHYGYIHKHINIANMTTEEAQDIISESMHPELVDKMQARVFGVIGLRPFDTVYIEYPKLNALVEYYVESFDTIIDSDGIFTNLSLNKTRILTKSSIRDLTSKTTELIEVPVS